MKKKIRQLVNSPVNAFSLDAARAPKKMQSHRQAKKKLLFQSSPH